MATKNYDMGNDNKLATNLIKSNCVTVSDIAVEIRCNQRLVFYLWCKTEKRKKVKYVLGSCLTAVDSSFEKLTNI